MATKPVFYDTVVLEQGKLRRLAKAQRQAAAVFLRLLRFQDLMVLMMVAATIAGAYATWRL